MEMRKVTDTFAVVVTSTFGPGATPVADEEVVVTTRIGPTSGPSKT